MFGAGANTKPVFAPPWESARPTQCNQFRSHWRRRYTANLSYPRGPVHACSGAISSTSRTIARRNFGFSTSMNALAKDRPSDVARKSVTYEAERGSVVPEGQRPGAVGASSKKNETGT
jgi:hypothetical protein